MNTPEERSGELLWRHVVDLRNQELDSALDAVPASLESERELAEIMRLAGELPGVLSTVQPRYEADARARLMSLIARDEAVRARKRWWQRVPGPKRAANHGSRLTLALAVGLLLLAVAAWTMIYVVNRDTCGTGSPAPTATSQATARRAASPTTRR